MCVSSETDQDYDIHDYYEYRDNFLDQTEIDALTSECLSLGFSKKTGKAVVQNRFISPLGEPYSWDSSNGPVVNDPINLDDFPLIKSTMARINREFGCNLNCSLVSYYKNGKI